ncbi:hypothetical protein HanXRQr2_Chr05g0214061 [Helianthus annuus]|uniref:Uncharacterized protein n=1 Tax=Helianthus annuus TaxID=4232 RepID=A0A9K3IZL8_HELAN|nr:hypothetical protein HanXRQr2_Chr05g0214061 [Helianthus annuus]
MADELPLWFPPMSSDDSSDSSILFFQNLIEEAELQDTGTSNRRRYIELQREEGHETLMADYFVEDPKYNEDIFRHRFRMSKRLFLKIVSDVEENDPWFVEAPDARGRKGFTPLQKVTSAIKQLATDFERRWKGDSTGAHSGSSGRAGSRRYGVGRVVE